jgi:hypothetical protein
MRTKIFFQIVLGSANMVLAANGKVTNKLFTDHAKVQIGVGKIYEIEPTVHTYRGENVTSAAHFMNVSLDKKVYSEGSNQ